MLGLRIARRSDIRRQLPVTVVLLLLLGVPLLFNLQWWVIVLWAAASVVAIVGTVLRFDRSGASE